MAQLSNATIKGTVADSTGGVLPQVNRGTDEHRHRRAARAADPDDGSYSFAALPPGEYEVKTAAAGFAGWAGKLTLRVAQEAVVNPVLQAASVNTSVTVEDVTPVISTEASSLSDVKEASRIKSLPLQNSDFRNILNFSPGVVSAGFAGQGQGYTRVNGIPGGSIDYLVDGMSASERYTNELQRLPQPIPTIQEIKVSTANANAEYSRPGMVEVVTKSGTNQFHGELFELNQNSALSAKSFHQQAGKFPGPQRIRRQLFRPCLAPETLQRQKQDVLLLRCRRHPAALRCNRALYRPGRCHGRTATSRIHGRSRESDQNLRSADHPLDPRPKTYVRDSVPRQRHPCSAASTRIAKKVAELSSGSERQHPLLTRARTIRTRTPARATTTR